MGCVCSCSFRFVFQRSFFCVHQLTDSSLESGKWLIPPARVVWQPFGCGFVWIGLPPTGVSSISKHFIKQHSHVLTMVHHNLRTHGHCAGWIGLVFFFSFQVLSESFHLSSWTLNHERFGLQRRSISTFGEMDPGSLFGKANVWDPQKSQKSFFFWF